MCFLVWNRDRGLRPKYTRIYKIRKKKKQRIYRNDEDLIEYWSLAYGYAEERTHSESERTVATAAGGAYTSHLGTHDSWINDMNVNWDIFFIRNKRILANLLILRRNPFTSNVVELEKKLFSLLAMLLSRQKCGTFNGQRYCIYIYNMYEACILISIGLHLSLIEVFS